MPQPIRYDIVAERSLVFIDTVDFLGENLTGATFAMQVRQHPDLGGTANANLATVTDNSEGVRLMYAGSMTVSSHIAAGRLSPEIYQVSNPATGNLYQPTDTVADSNVRILIGQPTMDALPPAPEVGDDIHLHYDLLVTISGSVPVKRLYGLFTVRGTVTR